MNKTLYQNVVKFVFNVFLHIHEILNILCHVDYHIQLNIRLPSEMESIEYLYSKQLSVRTNSKLSYNSCNGDITGR